MAKVISLFVKDEISLDELILKFQHLIGHDFVQYRHDGLGNYVTQILGVNISMYDEHGLVDDLGIDFSNYRYEIDFEILRTYVNNDSVAKVHEALPHLFCSQLAGIGAIIVKDLQRVVSIN